MCKVGRRVAIAKKKPLKGFFLEPQKVSARAREIERTAIIFFRFAPRLWTRARFERTSDLVTEIAVCITDIDDERNSSSLKMRKMMRKVRVLRNKFELD